MPDSGHGVCRKQANDSRPNDAVRCSFGSSFGVVVERLSECEFRSKQRKRRITGVPMYFQSDFITMRICDYGWMLRRLCLRLRRVAAQPSESTWTQCDIPVSSESCSHAGIEQTQSKNENARYRIMPPQVSFYCCSFASRLCFESSAKRS